MTHNLALLKALTFTQVDRHTTPLIEYARIIYKQNTGNGMGCNSSNRLRDMRDKGYVESESDLLSAEVLWRITDEGIKHLEQSLAVKFQ